MQKELSVKIANQIERQLSRDLSRLGLESNRYAIRFPRSMEEDLDDLYPDVIEVKIDGELENIFEQFEATLIQQSFPVPFGAGTVGYLYLSSARHNQLFETELKDPVTLIYFYWVKLEVDGKLLADEEYHPTRKIVPARIWAEMSEEQKQWLAAWHHRVDGKIEGTYAGDPKLAPYVKPFQYSR
jgi:hypothetical protein